MNNLIVLPMVLPILVGILLVFLQKHLLLQRLFSFMILIANSVISLYLLHNIQTKGIMRLDFGEWEPPFGILFVADSFAMLLVLSTSVVSAIVLLYSMYATGEQIEKRYFYSFILCLIGDVSVCFLTVGFFIFLFY